MLRLSFNSMSARWHEQLFVGTDEQAVMFSASDRSNLSTIRHCGAVRPSGLGLLALVYHVKTVAGRRRRSCACDICIFPRQRSTASAAATWLAWLVSRGRSWPGARVNHRGRVHCLPGRRRHEATRHDHARQTCYSLPHSYHRSPTDWLGHSDTSAGRAKPFLLVFRRTAAVLLINRARPGQAGGPVDHGLRSSRINNRAASSAGWDTVRRLGQVRHGASS